MESPSVATFVPTQFLQCNIKRQACVLTCKICVSVYVGGAEEEGLYSVIMEYKSSSSFKEGCAFLCACLCRCLCLFLVLCLFLCRVCIGVGVGVWVRTRVPYMCVYCVY
jgi:hypothetical protein